MRPLAMRARDLARHFGVDLVRYPTHDVQFRVAKLLERMRVNCVLDVGANTGQYAEELRSLGYEDRIVSFEPLDDAYARLHRAALRDALWITENIALGAENVESVIHVARNSYSSSLREMLPRHEMAAPSARIIGTQPIMVRRLDSCLDELAPRDSTIFLKVDAQGFEDMILEGCGVRIGDISGLQLEMSLEPLYDGQPLFDEVFDVVRSKGFRLVDIAPEFSDGSSATLLQVNGVFVRS